MHKFYSILIGENPLYTKTFQPASKRKIALYANCLMIPVILWFINSYLLVSNVLHGTAPIALLTGLIAALIIFLIERALIMSNGSRSIFWFRMLLSIIVASLGSISFDEVIFKNDIDNKVAEYKKTATDNTLKKIESDNQNKITLQQSIVIQKVNDWNISLQDAKGEADGTSGSHQKLVGKIALFKMKVADKKEADYISESKKLDRLKVDLDNYKEEGRERTEANFNGNALLLRIRALFSLIYEDWAMDMVYFLFTALLFCLEFVVVLIKNGTQNSVDEDIEKARDALLREKINKILERRSDLFESEQFIPSVKAAKSVLNQRNSSSLY